MYQFMTESLLGLRLEATRLYFAPRIPSTWNSFKLHYRYRQTVYHITIQRLPDEVPDEEPGEELDEELASRIVLDGVRQPEVFLSLMDDMKEHSAIVGFRNTSSADLCTSEQILLAPLL
jgi:cellobiose phosphorylase